MLQSWRMDFAASQDAARMQQLFSRQHAKNSIDLLFVTNTIARAGNAAPKIVTGHNALYSHPQILEE